MPMSLSDSKYEERVELTDDAKDEYGQEYVLRSDYRDFPTRAVAVLTFGETRGDFWIQQRPSDDCKGDYWEVVAGSKSVNHSSAEEAAKEEVREELYGHNLGDAPEELNLEYIGETYKDTENEQKVDIFIYDSGRNDFPGSDEVQQGRFIDRKEIPQTVSKEDVTDCAKSVLKATGLLDNPEKSLEELARNNL